MLSALDRRDRALQGDDDANDASNVSEDDNASGNSEDEENDAPDDDNDKEEVAKGKEVAKDPSEAYTPMSIVYTAYDDSYLLVSSTSPLART
ncbi:hypothetical protein EMPG_11714 [Blastomyces silverae]|uniref:Uncharacterized protein n=1 Tax=Blastomyces silverae TaxID=2060906 RepID=A0A0H1BP91_9EURO|nr:hypothetical protein EMPG_11714 [Blastomyces silverae]